MVPPTIPEGRTERLLLRPLSLEDAPQIQRLFPQWKVVKYLAAKVPWPYPPDGAEQFIRDAALPQMERGEAWYWTLRLSPDPSQLIGLISLTLGEDEKPRRFWLRPCPPRPRRLHDRGLRLGQRLLVRHPGPALASVPPKAVANRAFPPHLPAHGHARHPARNPRLRLPAAVCLSEIWEITAEDWQALEASLPPGSPSNPGPAPGRRKAPSAPKSAPRPPSSPSDRPIFPFRCDFLAAEPDRI